MTDPWADAPCSVESSGSNPSDDMVFPLMNPEIDLRTGSHVRRVMQLYNTGLGAGNAGFSLS